MTSMALARGMGAVTFPASFQENLNIIICVEESSAETTATSTGLAFAFAFEALVEAALEVTAKASDRLPGETTPSPLSSAVLIEELFCSLSVTQTTEVWYVQGFFAIIGRGS